MSRCCALIRLLTPLLTCVDDECVNTASAIAAKFPPSWLQLVSSSKATKNSFSKVIFKFGD
jgi:hypothetical protein